MFNIFFFVVNGQEGLLKRLVGNEALEGEQQGGQQDQVGEHGHEKGEGHQQAQGDGASKLGKTEDAKAEEEDDGGVNHTQSGFFGGQHYGGTYVPVGFAELLTVLGQKVDGIVDRDAEGDAEDQDGGGFDGDAEIAHEGGGGDEGNEVGNK